MSEQAPDEPTADFEPPRDPVQVHINFIREFATGPMSNNPEHAGVCNGLTATADKLEQMAEALEEISKQVDVIRSDRNDGPRTYTLQDLHCETRNERRVVGIKTKCRLALNNKAKRRPEEIRGEITVVRGLVAGWELMQSTTVLSAYSLKKLAERLEIELEVAERVDEEGAG